MKRFWCHFHEYALKFRLTVLTVSLLFVLVFLLTGITGFYSARTLKKALEQNLAEDVRRGADTFSRFHREISTQLELWNAQPIVQVFFNNPALAAISQSGLSAFFRKVRDSDPWIADILLIDGQKILYEDSGILELLSPEQRENFARMPASSVLTPVSVKDRKIPMMVLCHPFSANGAVQPGRQIVLVMDPQQINERLFGCHASGTPRAVTLAIRCPDNTIRVLWLNSVKQISPKFARDLRTAAWQSFSAISDRYPSLILHHQDIPQSPVIAAGIASQEEIRQPVLNLIFISVTVGVFICLAGILLSLILAEKITAPLAALSTKAESFLASSGRYEEMTVSDCSGDEIGILENVFEIMLKRIRDYTLTLEEKVSLRTQELEQANRKMQNEIAVRRKAEDAAEAANRAKSAFLANMSHEIRTPMNAVMGFISLVLDDSALPEKQRKYLHTAYQSAKALLSLINDILDVSKLESGRVELENAPFRLHTAVKETMRTLEVSAKNRGLALETEIHPDVPDLIVGDAVRLRQILMNLTVNAIKFTEKGHVRLEIRRENRERLLFSVSDTGIGIPADRLDRIFDPFTQADSSTTRRFGGTGLGTTISRQLVELMGGQIQVESQEGKGSTFHFTVRMKETDRESSFSENREIAETAAQQNQPRRCFAILIAEDIEENILLAKIRLEQQGHTVTAARNGQEAVDAFEREHPDIILMDVHMPEMDGLEAAKLIRKMEAPRHGDHSKAENSHFRVPIIALTASMMKEEQESCLNAGMDLVAGKPVDFEQLFETMEKLVPKDRGFRGQGAGAGAAVSGVCKQEAGIGNQISDSQDHLPATGNLPPVPSPPVHGAGIGNQISGSQDHLPESGSRQPAACPQSPATSHPVNWEKGLETWQNETAYKKALLSFCREYENAAQKILSLLEERDKDGAYRMFHTLKGVAGNLCVPEVFRIASELNAQVREKPAGELIPDIEMLGDALHAAVQFIRQMETENREESAEIPAAKQELNAAAAKELVDNLMEAFRNFNPEAAEPLLVQLEHLVSPQQIEAIRRETDRFDFDKAGAELAKLAQDIGIAIE